MKINKIVVAGASGALGSSIINNKLKNYKYYGLSYKKQKNNFLSCNLTIKKNVFKILNLIKPELIINAAAIIDINYCEKYPKKSFKVNYIINKNICDWILTHSPTTKLLFISSDQVYGLNKFNNIEKIYSPINVYGKHKIKSEKYISKINNYLILRVNFVGKGTANNSFTDWIFNSFKTKKKINLYNNVYFNPVTKLQLVNIIKTLIKKNTKGIYNIGCNNKKVNISKAHFALIFAKKLNIYNEKYKIINYYNEKKKVKRPLDMTMNISKVNKIIKMPSFYLVIKKLTEEYNNA